jgi:uncharacterized LabA/DUF88 family protein
LNIAVFIDFDNIEIGVKSTLGQQFDVGAILDAIKERGEVVTKIAYADWTRAGEYSRSLTQHAIRLVQRNLTPGGDKNGADINLALDALEMVFTHQHINAYVIVGGDSDFLSLVEKLKQYDKKVFVVGGRAFTSVILQRNCHEFIAYENLSGVRKQAIKSGRPMPTPASAPVAQAVPIVRRALKILADREVSPQTGLLKSTLLQLDSTFSERTYGASSFLDFVEKLAQAGLVQLKHAGRSVMVELTEGREGAIAISAPAEQDRVPADHERGEESGVAPQDMSEDTASAFDSGHSGQSPLPIDGGGEPRGDGGAPFYRHADSPQPYSMSPVQATEPPADGVKRVGEILKAATNARWPMYLRNVKQLLRTSEGGFDERRYGFGGLVDLVRACQKEGLVRLERDRRGGLRVFPGIALQRPIGPRELPMESRGNTMPPEPAREPQREIDVQQEPVEVDPGNALNLGEALDVDAIDPDPMPTIDPTAELLGTSARRKRPARTPAAAARRPVKNPPRKAAPAARPRSKRAAKSEG